MLAFMVMLQSVASGLRGLLHRCYSRVARSLDNLRLYDRVAGFQNLHFERAHRLTGLKSAPQNVQRVAAWTKSSACSSCPNATFGSIRNTLPPEDSSSGSNLP